MQQLAITAPQYPLSHTVFQALHYSDVYTSADMLLDYLLAHNIDTMFGVPGGAIEPLLNAVSRNQKAFGPIRSVIARHETGAAFMADGYYRETRKLAVVFSTTGPGTTNLITGVASAYSDNIPMLIITAQTPLPKFGRRALQESSCTSVDTVAMFQSITHYNTLVSHADQLEHKLRAALLAAYQNKGPVHLSIPSDVLRQDTCKHAIKRVTNNHDHFVDTDALKELLNILEQDSSIAVIVGEGCHEASQEIMEFLNLTDLPFMSTPIGKSFVDETHKNYLGVYGFAGHASAKQLLQSTRVVTVIAIGCTLDELSTSGWSPDLLNYKLVHIDSCAEHFTRSGMAKLQVYGNIKYVFECMNTEVENLIGAELAWSNVSDKTQLNACGGYAELKNSKACTLPSSTIKPQYLMHRLSHNLVDDARIFVDAGNSWAWATHYLTRKNSDGKYHIAMGFGSMAWSVGAAIGSAFATNEPTVCIVGDGSFLMSSHEITVAVQHNLPIVFLVLNDSAMGMVMHGQKLGGQESIGWELNVVDFAAIAKASGAYGTIVRTTKELDAIDLNVLFLRNGPTLIDVRIDRNEVPPMGDRIKGLAQQSATPGG